MLYKPNKYPDNAFIIITLIIITGIVGSLFSDYFIAIALIFWIQYTAVLSYNQFKRKSKRKHIKFTEVLLNPKIRFFLFEFIAIVGLLSVIVYRQEKIGIISLIIWWLFAYNFYRYYKLK